MPSFDVVSEIDLPEVENALNQSRKELDTRYDFRGSKAEINYEHPDIKLKAEDDMKIEALRQILAQKMSKRGVSLKSLKFGEIEDSAGSMRLLPIKLIQGISTEEAKKITKSIKDQKLKKIQASIQGDQIRVTSPKRDDLQGVIEFLKKEVTHLELQFTNFRD